MLILGFGAAWQGCSPVMFRDVLFQNWTCISALCHVRQQDDGRAWSCDRAVEAEGTPGWPGWVLLLTDLRQSKCSHSDFHSAPFSHLCLSPVFLNLMHLFPASSQAHSLFNPWAAREEQVLLSHMPWSNPGRL